MIRRSRRIAPASALLGALGGMAGEPALERRVARVLGVERSTARVMLAAVKLRIGARGYRVRGGSFLVATSMAGRVLPGAAREVAVRSLVGKLLERPGDVLFYLGELPEPPAGACRGLVDA
jgi:hypothetical protein